MTSVVFVLLLLVTGCGPNVSEVVKALAADPATVKLDVTTPWGSFHLDRSNTGTVQVPVQIVPVKP